MLCLGKSKSLPTPGVVHHTALSNAHLPAYGLHIHVFRIGLPSNSTKLNGKMNFGHLWFKN